MVWICLSMLQKPRIIAAQFPLVVSGQNSRAVARSNSLVKDHLKMILLDHVIGCCIGGIENGVVLIQTSGEVLSKTAIYLGTVHLQGLSELSVNAYN